MRNFFLKSKMRKRIQKCLALKKFYLKCGLRSFFFTKTRNILAEKGKTKLKPFSFRKLGLISNMNRVLFICNRTEPHIQAQPA